MAQPSQEFVKESNKALWISGIVIAIFVLALLTNGFGLFNGKSVDVPSIPLSIDNSPVLGNENSLLTIYEFSDFSCPYCAAASGKNPSIIAQLRNSNPNWEPPIPNIIKDYVETGKVKIVFKYASGHGTGRPAHTVGLALYNQNPSLFWEFHDLAFENQNLVSNLAEMKTLARELGADMEQLEKDISTNNFYSQLEYEDKMGASNGVQGTPTFIINGRIISGALSYLQFKTIIEQELNKI